MLRKVLIIMIITAFISACGGEDVKAFDPAEHVRPIKMYKITSLKRMDVRTYPGKIKAGKKVDVSFIVPGSVIELEVKEGDYIEKGKLIAKLDNASYKHNLNTINAQLEEATLAYQRAKKLWVANAISKAEYDRAKSSFDVLKSQKNLAKKSLSDTYIYAPFSGFVARRYIDNFQTVSAGSPIVSVQNIKDIEVEVNIPEILIIGRTKTMDYKAFTVFEIPSYREYEMQLKEIASEADPVTQTYLAKFVMPSPDDINVLPGMTVAAKIVISENYESGQYEVPESAVFSDSTGKVYAWVIGSDMKVSKREIKTDGLKDNKVIVLSGLKEGEEIAAAGLQHLSEGMEVKRLAETEIVR